MITADPATRQQYLDRARSSPPLDGVFWALYFNHSRMWPPSVPKSLRLDPREVFPGLAPELVEQYAQRANALFAWEGPLGAAYFNYSGHPRSYEEELRLFEQQNPGFSSEVYSAVVSLGILAMR